MIENINIDMLPEEERIALFVEERNAIMRQVDDADFDAKFDAFWSRWKNPVPEHGWKDRSVPRGMMHKARLHVEGFSRDEKAHSRTWLKKNGYTEDIGGYSPSSDKYR